MGRSGPFWNATDLIWRKAQRWGFPLSDGFLNCIWHKPLHLSGSRIFRIIVSAYREQLCCDLGTIPMWTHHTQNLRKVHLRQKRLCSHPTLTVTCFSFLTQSNRKSMPVRLSWNYRLLVPLDSIPSRPLQPVHCLCIILGLPCRFCFNVQCSLNPEYLYLADFFVS